MEMCWPGNFTGLDWSVCTEFTYRSLDGTPMSGCRGLLAPHVPHSGPYFGSLASNQSSNARAPILVFGGNTFGETASGELTDAFFSPLYRNTSDIHPTLEVYSSSYRSYTPNDGKGSPTESTVVDDAEALLDIAIASPSGVRSGGKVIILGFSLGCAVSLELAARRPEAIAGIILASPWSSLWAMCLTIWAPVSYAFVLWLWLADRWDSIANAAALPLDIPVAILSPLEDEVVPHDMHKEVYDALKTSRKWFMTTESAGHGDINEEAHDNAKQISAWLKAACARFSSGC